MKKYGLELMLGCLLLVSFLILSKQAAEVSETMSSTENSKTILVDAGHGGADPGMIGVNGLEEKGINCRKIKGFSGKTRIFCNHDKGRR